MHIHEWLQSIPPLAVYGTVGLMVGLESMGIPLPGEIALISAALLATGGHVNPMWVAVAGIAGAVIGDNIGFMIGRRGGRPLLDRLGRRFPKHLGPAQQAKAEQVFGRWGVWAVFFGRFVALLRILAGPLAGALRMRYPRFLLANTAGGVVWAGGITLVVHYVGKVAEKWLKDFSWAALLAAVVVGMATSAYLHRRANRIGAEEDVEDAPDQPVEVR